MKLEVYRRLLTDRQTRRFLAGLGVSALGDALSIVTIAWLAVVTALAGDAGIFVGVAVAAYTLPGVVGAAGRKTSRVYRQPVSYVQDGDVLLTPGGADGSRTSARANRSRRGCGARPSSFAPSSWATSTRSSGSSGR